MTPRIVKRGDLYALCYRYADESGKIHAKIERFASQAEALLKMHEIVQKQKDGTFIPPNTITVSELMTEFIESYGCRKWVASTYTANVSLCRNYIHPILGGCPIQNLNAKDADIYISVLCKTPSAVRYPHRHSSPTLSASTVKKTIDLLRRAFQYAVNRNLVAQNPFENAVLPEIRVKGVFPIS